MKREEDYLCEVSWEVCNKVGGIHTVVTSKAPHINQKIKNYLLIGPYHDFRQIHDFVEEVPSEELKEVFSELRQVGVSCLYGKWMIKSEPKVVLINFSHMFAEKDQIKSKLWELYKIDSLNAPYDFDEPLVFSVAVAKFIDALQRKTQKKVVSQFHEWLCGAGLLWLKHINPKVASIFTTHATVLGRAMVGSDSNFYSNIQGVDSDKEAKSHFVVAKHGIEKASAQNADVFSTVSEITGFEAEHLLGRKPDVILPNGIDLESFSSFEGLAMRHSELKHMIKDFVISSFFPYYSFELDNALIFFIFGRYEYENKGIDIFIDALGRLNKSLIEENSDKTIISFFFIPADSYGINHDVLENKTIYADMEKTIDNEKTKIMDKVNYLIASDENIKKTNLFEKEFLDVMRKKMVAFQKKGSPSYVTHDLKNYDNDAIINGFKRAGLFNRKEDKVKVVFYPAYLKSTDNLLGLDVYDAILGGHLGVFPSAYEPWGYTPLESAALGVASVTSDLSGFGQYIQKTLQKESPGVFVNKRFGKGKEETIDDLYKILKYYSSLDKEGRIQNKIEARRIAAMCDWKKMIEYYFKAYDLALDKRF